MKLFKSEDFIGTENPNPTAVYRRDILADKDKAKDLGGIFSVLPPGGRVPYHYHNKRESIIIILSGEAVEIIDGKEFSIKVGNTLFIPPGEKHSVINRSDEEVRFLEFFTCPPAGADFEEVK